MKNLLNFSAALGVATERLIREGLDDLEVVSAFVAAIFVSRHGSKNSGEVDKK
ncbi:MAG TPA: hypothetical protein VJ935_06000 [Acidimicrobiia bacterium]|nr:hypothetical protein [Acidimicrobiia bacterium]